MVGKKVISFSLDQKVVEWLEHRTIENLSNRSIEVNKLLRRAMKKEKKNGKKEA